LKKITTDILIIGSGGAGLRLAIELFEKGKKNILIVGDCKFRDAHTRMAQGGVNAPFSNMENEKDSPLVHALDTFLEGQNIGNPNIIERLTNNAKDAINDLVDMGAQFHREPNGKISQRYFGAQTYRRTIFKGDATGHEILRVLSDRVEKLKIPNIDKLYIMKLLVKDNNIYGAIGIKNNELVLIEASIVVLATGGHSNLYTRSSSRLSENFGEGTALAFREGAVLGDMEMLQFHPTGLVFPEEKAGELVTEAVRGEGGILTNRLGERFMKKYSPERMELSTRDVVARSNYLEIIAGRGTKRGAVYLDISSRPKKYILERLPEMYKMLKKYNNIDISKEKMEIAPTAHYAMGGIRVDEKTNETAINDLYAVGECTVGVHGANRLGGNSLAEVVVFGKLVGRYLAGKKIKAKVMPKSLVNDFEAKLDKEILKNGKLDAQKMIFDARNIMWEHAGIVRNEKQLKAGLKKLDQLREKIAKQGLSNAKTKFETLVQKTRLASVLDLGELVIRGAIERKESRGAHFRDDFPKKSNSYLKNFFFQRKNGKVTVVAKPVPSPSATLKKGLKEFEKTHNYTHLE